MIGFFIGLILGCLFGVMIMCILIGGKMWKEMYELIIETIYNTIKLVIDDYNTPEVQEILEQPYIISVELHKIKNRSKVRKKDNEMMIKNNNLHIK